MTLTYVWTCLSLICTIVLGASTPAALPADISALVIAFEDTYDLSLVASALTTSGVNTVMIVEKSYANNFDVAPDIRLWRFSVKKDSARSTEGNAIEACKSFLKSEKLFAKIKAMRPTFMIFPALRHDVCLIPMAKSLKSIPVIWVQSRESEWYTFYNLGVAIPVFTGYMWDRAFFYIKETLYSYFFGEKYTDSVLTMYQRELQQPNVTLQWSYSNVHLILWGIDPILRTEYAPLSNLLVQVGCHHCRQYSPLPAPLYKTLSTSRFAFAVVVLLDDKYEQLIVYVANRLQKEPGRLGMIWRAKDLIMNQDRSSYLVVYTGNLVRQDLIGYPLTRMVLCHCTDTEFLEAAYHAKAIICIPRNEQELKNAHKAVELDFGYLIEDNSPYEKISHEKISNAIIDIHERTDHVTAAAKVSEVVRDRPSFTSDKILHWLTYLTKLTNKDNKLWTTSICENFFYRERLNFDIIAVIGLFLGIAFCLLTELSNHLLTLIPPNWRLRRDSFSIFRKFYVYLLTLIPRNWLQRRNKRSLRPQIAKRMLKHKRQ